MKYNIHEFTGVDDFGNFEQKFKLSKICKVTGKEFSTIIPARLYDNIDDVILVNVFPNHTSEERWFIETGETPDEAIENFNPTDDETI